MLIDQALDELRETSVLVTLPGEGSLDVADIRALDGCLGARVVQDELRALFHGAGAGAELEARMLSMRSGVAPRFQRLPLEEFFIELVGGRK
ncbi:MAG: hypothetical protein AAGG01_11430 [Planctomycetota bacterium]